MDLIVSVKTILSYWYYFFLNWTGSPAKFLGRSLKHGGGGRAGTDEGTQSAHWVNSSAIHTLHQNSVSPPSSLCIYTILYTEHHLCVIQLWHEDGVGKTFTRVSFSATGCCSSLYRFVSRLSRLGPQELKGESDTENDTLLGVPVGLLTVEVHLRVGTEVGFQRAPVLVRSSPRQSFNKWRSRRDKKASRTLPKSSWEWRNSTCLVFGFHGSFHKTHPT